MRSLRDHWRSPEILWPLSIGLGFLGAWPGSHLGWPLLLLLGGALGPLLLALRLSADKATQWLWSVPVGGLLGLAACWADGVYSGRLKGSPLALVSGSDPVGELVAAGLAADRLAIGAPTDPWSLLLLLGPFLLGVLLARPLSGLLAWVGWMAIAVECTAHTSRLAAGLLAKGASEAEALALAWPPWWVLSLLAGSASIAQAQHRLRQSERGLEEPRQQSTGGILPGGSWSFPGGSWVFPGGSWAISLVLGAILMRLGLASSWWAWLRGELPASGVW